MEIQVLGPGCPKCRRVEKVTRQAIADMGVEATIAKVTDWDGILTYEILATPGLVIDEQVVSSGRIPSKDEVTTWVANALAEEGG